MIHGEARVANVVLDIGSYHTFAGQAGFENPRFASYSYLVEHTSHKKPQYYAGNQALNSQNYTKQIHSIFESVGPDGKVQKFHFDINRLDKFVQTILIDNLELENCNISLLIAQDVAVDLQPNEVLRQRQKIADYLLDGMQLSNIAFVKKPILSAFGLGRTSGVVLDSGHSFTHCSIIQDGYCVHNKSLRFGGSLIHSMIRQQIQAEAKSKPWRIALESSVEPFKSSDIEFHKTLQLQNIIRSFETVPIKSSMPPESQEVTYTLPDNQVIKINRTDVADPFINYKNFYNKYLKNFENLPPYIDKSFYPIISGYNGLEQLIYDTIDEYFVILDNKNRTIVSSNQGNNGIYGNDSFKKRLPQLTSEDLLNNVILTGGNLSFADLGWSIDHGIRKRGGNTLQSPLNFNKDANGNSCTRNNSTSWIGGSIICNLPVFNHFWIKLSEWKEVGSALTASKAVGPETIKAAQTTEAQQYIKRNKKQEILSKKCP